MKNRKKFAALFLSAALVVFCAGCGNGDGEGSGDAGNGSTEVSGEVSSAGTESSDAGNESSETGSGEESAASNAGSGEEAASGEPISYAEYIAAELDTEVVIEAYVQAKQSWWEEKASLYTQDQDGAYFVYNAACSEEDYAKLTPGTKIRVTGYKGEWSGEVEIMDATFEIIEGGDSYVAEAEDVTALLGKEELIDYQNRFVSFKGMTVEAMNENGDAFLYKWDGSGQDGDDLYFKVSLNGETYTFTVESYLCDNTTDVYAAVKALNVGDTIDMEGFLYWYEGVNPHITSVTAAE